MEPRITTNTGNYIIRIKKACLKHGIFYDMIFIHVVFITRCTKDYTLAVFLIAYGVRTML